MIAKTSFAALLQADVFVGVAADRLQSYAPVHELQFSRLVAESMKTKLGGSAVDVGFFELLGILNAFRKLSKGISKPAFAQYKDMDMTKFGPLFNTEDLRRGETSSANGECGNKCYKQLVGTQDIFCVQATALPGGWRWWRRPWPTRAV